MAKVILGNAVVADEWTLVALPVRDEPVKKQAGKAVLFKLTGEAAATDAEVAGIGIPGGKVIVPMSVWLGRHDELTGRLAAGQLGVWLDSFEEPETLAASVQDINAFKVIAVNFPKFIDGRGFSVGRLLRERFGYRNELRAIGDVLRDQMFFFKRCGFDAYALRADRDAQDALAGLRDFSDPYQGAVDEPRPLFRRVARSA